MLEPEVLAAAIKKGAAQERNEVVSYVHFREKFKGILRGTVIVEGRIIEGYPKIARIFSLANGLQRNVPQEEVFVEEKIDGYNVRCAYVGGRVVAFSRSGMIDYFACEKLSFLKPFFKAYPQYILCGEMIGNTPYTAPTRKFDVRFLIFDIVDDSGAFLPVEDRYTLLRTWNLEGVPSFGRYVVSNTRTLKELARRLHEQGREGLVFKSPDRKVVIKYVTASSDAHDLETASALFDLPLGFISQRLLRSAIFVKENGISKKEYATLLGNAFANRVLREVSGEEVFEEFCIRIKDEKIWMWIEKHMSKEVRLEVIERTREQGQTFIRFRKIYKKTSKTIRDAKAGKKQED